MQELVDLNADAGESFGRWRLGDDERVIPLVTSVNIACGWHAGDPATMRAALGIARDAGVAAGAHPGFPDLAGFGRRALALSPREAADACLYQFGALRALGDELGVPITHVKPHGALYGLAAREPDVAAAIGSAIAAAAPGVPVVLLAGPTADRVAALGVPVVREAFADLDYDDSGRIIIEPDPVAKDPAACAAQAIAVLRGTVTSVSGAEVPVRADSICLHGDRPNAVEIARAVRDAFAAAGVELAAMREVLRHRDTGQRGTGDGDGAPRGGTGAAAAAGEAATAPA
ncbi:LamB/YcsF family protein [Saccharopolyspora sp. MS10]|uniref:LamB/YcsF family protein n=1 Tax=Saccharopolyspora sp. MS10 TaxID=3385973 RepID=UPI00399F407D